jgi:hypothetical protein
MLYFERSKKVLQITKAKKIFHDLNFTEEVSQYNDCYLYCADRKVLVTKAKDIKQRWISEVEKEL